MKKGKIIITFLLLSLTLAFTACDEDRNKESNKGLDETTKTESDDSTAGVESEDPTSEVEEDIQTIYSDNVITWGTAHHQPSDAALSKINKRLIDMGYDFSLEMVALSLDDYHNELKDYENENGPLDIAFSGLEHVGDGGKILAMIKSGYFAQLDDFLNTNEGRKLLEIYDEKLWESVKVDNSIYTIPSGPLEHAGITFAFNKAYVNEDDIQSFTGDLSELKEYMDKIPFNEDFSHIVLDISDIDLFDLIDCDFKDGLLFTRDEKKAYNPYEYDEYKEICEVLSDYSKSKYINCDFRFDPGLADEASINDEANYLDEGDFFVYIGGNSDLSHINADIITYEKPAYIQTILSGSTGITANSKNKEEAFQLLSLAYTDEELANLLVYGVDGVDYKLEDGKAYTLDGEPYDAFMKCIYLGIHEMTYPNGEEDFETSRLVDKKKFYQDKTEVSPYIGFNFYNEEYRPAINKLEEINSYNSDVWKSEDMDAEWDSINERLKEAGVDELVTAVNEALDEHFK